VYINKQNLAELASLETTIFQVCVKRKNVKEKKNTQEATGYAAELSTHANISHIVRSLPTSRQQDVFALLVTSCQQVWNNLLTTCNNLVEIIRLVARLF
jgi:hypothetical protein